MPLTLPWQTQYRPLSTKQDELEAGDTAGKDDESIDTPIPYYPKHQNEGILLGAMLLFSFFAGVLMTLVSTHLLAKTPELKCFEHTSMWC